MAEKSTEVYMLAQRVSKLETSQEHTASAIEGLTDAVKELTAAMNTGRGWANAFFWIAGSGGIMGAVALIKQLFKGV